MMNCGSVMLLTEGMIIPIRARAAGKSFSSCRRSTIVAMIASSAAISPSEPRRYPAVRRSAMQRLLSK
jgi:hypothetical protein